MFKLQNGPLNNSEIPGVYKQTTENTGMYNFFKKQHSNSQQIVPSKNYAAHKIIPSNSVDYKKKEVEFKDDCEIFDTLSNSTSFPLIQKSHRPFSSASVDVENEKYDFTNRPYTPPEKRYSSSFGLRTHDRKHDMGKQRPRSSYIYKNVHAEELLISNDCNMSRVRSDKTLYNNTNVKIKNFPNVQFNSTFIQENLD